MKKFIVTLLLLIIPGLLFSKTVTLDEAIDIALHKTARGSMVKGNLEVAEQNYFANKINFYLPEISINGSVPAYTVDESYRFFGGATDKQLYKTRDLSYRSFIQMNQSLLTGGDVVITANLLTAENRYPNTRPDVPVGTFIDENTRRGYFTFGYTQPLLKPSDSKYDLKNSRDDLEIARLIQIEEVTKLKKEVIEAYLGLVRASIKNELNTSRYNSTRLQAEIDSLKYLDGVISEEDWLISKSEALDAELSMFEAGTEADEKLKELYILLDWNDNETLETAEPADIAHFNDNIKSQVMSAWGNSVPILKAEYQYAKSQREADYKSSGHGLTGDFQASYSTGQGKVERDGIEDDIDTQGWEVSLNFSFPIWDGGAASAAVKSARLQAEQSRLEYEQSKQTARADIVNLVNQIDISYRRLDIMRKQIELAQNRLDIARSRFDDGQISEITLLESEADYLESRDKYLEELSHYLLDRTELTGKYVE